MKNKHFDKTIRRKRASKRAEEARVEVWRKYLRNIIAKNESKKLY